LFLPWRLFPMHSPELAQKKKIAIYGGAFNPPTNAHMTIAAEIVRTPQADELWLCPCGPRPDKPNMNVKPRERLVMCEIAVNTCFSQSFPIFVTDVEIEEVNMPTYTTLTRLQERHSDCVFSFVVGSDWLQPGKTDIRKWHNGEKLIEEFDFLVLKRPGFDCGDLEQYGKRFKYATLKNDYELITSNVSSTDARQRAGTKWLAHSKDEQVRLDLDALVPPGVHSYILKHKLYKPPARKKKVGIYGGDFDPPTNAHLLLAAEVLHHGHVDELWLCPTGSHADRTSPYDRYAMCEIAVSSWFSSYLPVSVTDVELSQSRNTYQTLCTLRDNHPDCQFAFVVGSDWLLGDRIRKWDDGDKLIKDFDILVMQRPNFQDEAPEGRFKLMELKSDYTLLTNSANEKEARKRARKSRWTGDGVHGLDGVVAPGVLSYIQKKKLYQDDDATSRSSHLTS